MRPSEFTKLIKKKGFKFDHHGTNHDFWRGPKGELVMVERHNREINKKTLHFMMKDAGLK